MNEKAAQSLWHAWIIINTLNIQGFLGGAKKTIAGFGQFLCQVVVVFPGRTTLKLTKQ